MDNQQQPDIPGDARYVRLHHPDLDETYVVHITDEALANLCEEFTTILNTSGYTCTYHAHVFKAKYQAPEDPVDYPPAIDEPSYYSFMGQTPGRADARIALALSGSSITWTLLAGQPETPMNAATLGYCIYSLMYVNHMIDRETYETIGRITSLEEPTDGEHWRRTVLHVSARDDLATIVEYLVDMEQIFLVYVISADEEEENENRHRRRFYILRPYKKPAPEMYIEFMEQLDAVAAIEGDVTYEVRVFSRSREVNTLLNEFNQSLQQSH